MSAGRFAQACIAPEFHARQHGVMRPPVLNPLFASLTSLPGVGPKLEKLYASCLIAKRRASSICCSTCRQELSTGASRPKLRDAQPDQVVTVAVTVDKHTPSPPHRSRAPYRIYTHDDTGRPHPHLFQCAPRLSGNTPAASAKHATSPARPSSMTACCRWCTRTAWWMRPALRHCRWSSRLYPLTEGLALGNVRRAMDGALGRLPDLPEWQDETWVAREQFPAFRQRIAQPAPTDRAIRYRSGESGLDQACLRRTVCRPIGACAWCARTCVVSRPRLGQRRSPARSHPQGAALRPHAFAAESGGRHPHRSRPTRSACCGSCRATSGPERQ